MYITIVQWAGHYCDFFFLLYIILYIHKVVGIYKKAHYIMITLKSTYVDMITT